MQVLKFLPSEKAQDARHFVESLQYWQVGTIMSLTSLRHWNCYHPWVATCCTYVFGCFP